MTAEINFAQLIFQGKTLLGYSEKEVWRMTYRKLDLLFKEYKYFYGLEKRYTNIDDIIPEDVN